MTFDRGIKPIYLACNIQWYRIPFPLPVDRNVYSLLNHMPCLPGGKVGFPSNLLNYLLSHMQFTQLSLTLYKQQRLSNLSPDYVSSWIAKIISSILPLLQAFKISKHSLFNISTKQVSKRSSNQPTFSENSDSKQ